MKPPSSRPGSIRCPPPTTDRPLRAPRRAPTVRVSPLLVAPPQPSALELLRIAGPEPSPDAERDAELDAEEDDRATVRRVLDLQPETSDESDEAETIARSHGEDEEGPTLVRACSAPTIRLEPTDDFDERPTRERLPDADSGAAPRHRSPVLRWGIVLLGIASLGVAVGLVVGMLLEPKRSPIAPVAASAAHASYEGAPTPSAQPIAPHAVATEVPPVATSGAVSAPATATAAPVTPKKTVLTKKTKAPAKKGPAADPSYGIESPGF